MHHAFLYSLQGPRLSMVHSLPGLIVGVLGDSTAASLHWERCKDGQAGAASLPTTHQQHPEGLLIMQKAGVLLFFFHAAPAKLKLPEASWDLSSLTSGLSKSHTLVALHFQEEQGCRGKHGQQNSTERFMSLSTRTVYISIFFNLGNKGFAAKHLLTH